MTSADALHVPELDLELVRERAPSRLPRWDPRLWGRLDLGETTRPGDRFRKLGLAWGRDRAKAAKLHQESVTPESDKASDSSFTGKEEDIEVGLIYFGKRFYSPYLGRWVSPDPLAVHQPGAADLNLYAYVSGKVLKAIDPIGLYTEENQAFLDQAEETTVTPFEEQAEKQHYYFEAPEGYEGEMGWQGELNDEVLDGFREAGFKAYRYEPHPMQLDIERSPSTAGGIRLTHDEQVIDMIEQYRSASRGSSPSGEGSSWDFDAWDRAREDYRPVKLGRAPWHGDRSVLRDTEHFLARYWLGTNAGRSQRIPYGLPFAPAEWWNPPILIDSETFKVHDTIYNPLRQIVEKYGDMAPSTPNMYQWEQRGYDYGECAGGNCEFKLWEHQLPSRGVLVRW